MKAKVIKATYRKDSGSFPDWLKYEIVILNEDGFEETVPAYGKDLQHALSRIVKSKKIERVNTITTKIPTLVWVALFFLYTLSFTIPAEVTSNPIWIICGFGGAVITFLGYKWWSSKNK